MKAIARFLCVLSLAAVCVACGGGGGGAAPVPPPPVIDASPGGIWSGIDSDGDLIVAFVTEAGRFHVIDEFGNQGSGILSVSNGNDVAGNFQLVTPLFVTFPDGTTLADCTLSGTVTERQTMSVTVDCETTAGLTDRITVVLDYSVISDRDSSLATIAGTYDDRSGVVTDIASDGTVFEQDPVSGCVINGQVSIIDDGAFNLYDYEFGYSSCTGPDSILNGSSFTGIVTLDNTVTPAPEMLVVFATGDVAGTLVSSVIIEERLSPPPPAPVVQWVNDFTSDVGSANLFGDAVLDSGSVRLTDSINDQLGSLVIDDLVPGEVIASFAARFDLQTGPGTVPPADGISFNLGPLPDSTFDEEGPLVGLTISFDTFDNLLPDHIGIDVIVNGVVVASSPIDPYTDGSFVRVGADFDTDGLLTLRFDGTPVFVDLPTGFTPQSSDRFGFGGRTGGGNQVNRIDNVRIFVLPL